MSTVIENRITVYLTANTINKLPADKRPESIIKRTTKPHSNLIKKNIFTQQKTLPDSQANKAFDDKVQLLEILHQAIARQQSYPRAAKLLHQTGTAEIGFLLSPQGRLTQIALIHSSGFTSLDQAAQAAAQQVSIIPQAEQLLTTVSYFTVKIVFA